MSASTSPAAWSWRQRGRDPRFAALLLLAAAAGFLASALFGGLAVHRVVGIAIVVAAFAVIGLVVLPPWRDPKHGPAAAAALLGGVAAVVVLLGFLL